MTDLYEVREAIHACRTIAPDLPMIASMTFTRDDRTLLGDSPTKVARQIAELGADVIGVNCSGGPNQILRILKQMRQAVPEARFSVMPNAGWPEQVGGRIMYPAAAGLFRRLRPGLLGEWRNRHRRLLRYHTPAYPGHPPDAG